MALISKTEAMEKFSEEYKNLTDTKKESFSRLINKLLKDNFVYVSLENDKQDYYSILSFRDIIEAYLSIIDYNLIHDDNNKFFYIETNTDRNKISLKKIDTVILLVLRLMYYKGTHEVTLNSNSANVIIKTSDLIENINNTQIFVNESYKTDMLNSLRLLKRYKIIGFNFQKLDEEAFITIYPTILQVVKNQNVETLNEQLLSFIKERGEANDIKED